MVAVLCTLMCTTSRAIYAMSQLRMRVPPHVLSRPMRMRLLQIGALLRRSCAQRKP